MSTYWIGVIVAFACIFFTLVAVYVTCFSQEFRKEYFLFLTLSFLSWIVPIAMVAGFVLYMLYFALRFIFSLFFRW